MSTKHISETQKRVLTSVQDLHAKRESGDSAPIAKLRGKERYSYVLHTIERPFLMQFHTGTIKVVTTSVLLLTSDNLLHALKYRDEIQASQCEQRAFIQTQREERANQREIAQARS